MKKIISLFQRNYDGDRAVRNEVTPGTEWVLNGEGIATRKWDGTCCLVKDGKLFKRYDVKKGKFAPPEFIPAQEPDATTGHWPGWLPVTGAPEDQWHLSAFSNQPDGTYELCGPKINGNPEGLSVHFLIPHGQDIIECPRDFDGIKSFLCDTDIEGIVWHHPDGRMAKIKAKDFNRGRHFIKTLEQMSKQTGLPLV